MSARLFYFADSQVAPLVRRLAPALLGGPVAEPADGAEPDAMGLVLVAATPEGLDRALRLRDRCPGLEVLALADASWGPGTAPAGIYGCLPQSLPIPLLAQLIGRALDHVTLVTQQVRGEARVRRLMAEFEALNTIGVQLSAETDTQALLELILAKAREITLADAGSLYLVEEGPGGVPRLSFELVQNDSVPVPFQGTILPVSSASVAGHVALTGQPVNLEDAYALPPGVPFCIDRSYDARIGYRSKSMLVVPMKNPKDQTIGVVQLINCKPSLDRRFASVDEIEREVVGFSPRFQQLALSLASQAAVALEKSRLYRALREAVQQLEASQERLVQAERLTALAEMAGGVAHDFNNHLAVILGHAEILRDQTDDPRMREEFAIIERAAVEGAQAVRRLQEFTRTRRTRRAVPVDLTAVAREAVRVTRGQWEDAARARGVVYDVRVEAAPVPPVSGDAAELTEALMNLVFNALDAMPGGGRVTVTTGVEGDRVVCRVADTGTGMAEPVRRRIFEPYFSTKNRRGSGLGLSVTYGIVTRHGGQIDVRSEVGQGTSATVLLPVAVESAPSAPAAVRDAPVPSLTVLVVDDESDVRSVLVRHLAIEGHRVTACADGAAAVDALDAERFDLVITDLGMPGLSGWDVARHVKDRWPATPVIMVTGWGEQIDPREARELGVDFVLPKPFRLDDVRTAIRRASSGRAPRS